MNKSEQLLSAFSQDYFFKELVFDELKYTPPGSTEIEIADLLINLGDIIIVVQLKTRNDEDQSKDSLIENKWLNKKCKLAKGQVKSSLEFISSGALPIFYNKRGQTVTFRADAKVIPLVVFDNDQIDAYPHLLRKHTESGMNINCMSFSDYCEMCRILVTPMEIAEYLEFRKIIFEEYGDVDILVMDGINNELILTKPQKNESLVHQFLAQKYGMKISEQQKNVVEIFRNFLHILPEHTVNSSTQNGSYEILLFFAHFYRDEIIKFWDLLEDTKLNAKKGKSELVHSLRTELGEYVIMFTTNGLRPIEMLLPMIKRVVEPKQVLEVDVHWFNKEEFGVDFLFWDDTK